MEQAKNSAEEKDREAFLQGLALAKGGLGLLHHLFAIRAGILTENMRPLQHLHCFLAYLSGQNWCISRLSRPIKTGRYI